MSASRQQLILPRWIIPVRPVGAPLLHHGLLVEDGHIAAIAGADDLSKIAPDAERVDLPHHALIPGLVNAHTHSAMNLLKGYRDDEDLHTWLNEAIWPIERRFVDAEFVRDGSDLALAEMIRGGTTTFNDDYFFPDVSAERAIRAGMRCMVGVPIMEQRNAWSRDASEALRLGNELIERFEGEPLVDVSLAPHAPYSVSDDTLRKIERSSAKAGVKVHMHVLETGWEVGHSLRMHGERPVQRLQRLGLFDERLMAVHMTQLLEEDVTAISQCGVQVVHCPESNLKLASGICPVVDLLSAEVALGLGTDGSASNNDLDMLGELRTAALLAKGTSGSPRALPAGDALELATLGGARVMGLADRIGSLEPGKAADVVAIDMSDVATQPVHDVVSQVVYAASRAQVSDVWVAGRRLLRSGQLMTLDVDEIGQRAGEWQSRLSTIDDSRPARGTA